METTGKPKVRVVLPAFNEAASIRPVIEDIHKKFKHSDFDQIEFIVVNDGSSDATGKIVEELAKEYPATLLTHKKNAGLGAALKTGMYFAIHASRPNDIILTTESDGTQPADKLVELAKIIRDGADFVVATPVTREDFEGVPFHRQVLSHGANFIYKTLFPIKNFHGYTNLLRGFKASMLNKALEVYGEDNFIDKTGFEAVPDIVLKLRPLKPKIAEVRIKINHTQMQRRSSIPILRTIKNSLALCFSHLRSNNKMKK